MCVYFFNDRKQATVTAWWFMKLTATTDSIPKKILTDLKSVCICFGRRLKSLNSGKPMRVAQLSLSKSMEVETLPLGEALHIGERRINLEVSVHLSAFDQHLRG